MKFNLHPLIVITIVIIVITYEYMQQAHFVPDLVTSNRKMWRNKIGRTIFKASYFIGKFLGLIGLEYDFGAKLFNITNRATVISSVICILAGVISPFVVKWNWEIYFISGADIDENMSLITAAQFGFGFATSFIVLLCQLWKRKPICRCANNFQEVIYQLTAEMNCSNIISLEMILLIVLKYSITIYEILINLPYFIEYGDAIATERLVGFILNLYIAEIAAFFSDFVFAGMLLLARFFHLMNELLEQLKMEIQADGMTRQKIHQCRRKLLSLIQMYLKMRGIVTEFGRCIEVAVFVQMLNSFANMLSNLYALLDFYAVEKCFEIKDLVYNVVIFLSICLLVYAAERVKQESEKLKDTLLEMDASGGSSNSKWRSDVLVFKIWPEVFEVDILGMFPLNHTFLLFLITYATNFVVIILQFELNRMK